MSRHTAFMSGAGQSGRWVPGPEVSAKAIMGGACIDFSQALFTHPVITVYAKAFWGGVRVIVPPNVVVEQNGQSVMGGFGSSGGLYSGSNGHMQGTSSSAGITIKVEGTAVMAGVGVEVNKRAAPAQLLTAEEAAMILCEVPEPPSKTRKDMLEQHLEGLGLPQLARAPVQAAAWPRTRAPMVTKVPVAGAKEAAPRKEAAPGTAVEAAVGAAAAAAKDWKQELKELKGLLDSGVLTEEEFGAQKARVLERAR